MNQTLFIGEGDGIVGMQMNTTIPNMFPINIVHKKLVKPCIPTPQNLKQYKLSSMDELYMPVDMDMGVLLFYENSKSKEINLEESLSKVLVQFYPLAGRYVLKDGYIDCSDEGAEFVEAEAPDVELGRLVAERDLANLAGLFPRKNHHQSEASYPLLSIQTTQLKCGGVVIGIGVSHKVFDASSLGTFVAAWSTASNHPHGEIINPVLGLSSSLFPLKRSSNSNPNSEIVSRCADTSRLSVKRFAFNKEAIASVRSSLRPRGGERGWSRVCVVSSVVAKALIGVEQAKRGGVMRPCFVSQAASSRERTTPPLPKHSCGNLFVASCIHCMESEGMGIEEWVDVISEGLNKSIAICADVLSSDEDGVLELLVVAPIRKAFEAWHSGEADLLTINDWSKFGFYDADFGWGKPASAGIVPVADRNVVLLMANKEGDGIEAWVHLEKNDMALFEQDDDIRLLAT